MTRSFTSFACVALVAAMQVVMAQGPGPGTPGHGPGIGVPQAPFQLDFTKQIIVEGAVTAVNIALGTELPTIEVNQEVIKVGPAWFLLENDFELKEGDQVTVKAAPSTNPADPYLHAIEIVNTATNAQITLRDTNGAPLWFGPRGQPFGGQELRSGFAQRSPYAGCADPGSVQNRVGVIESISMGSGIQFPRLVLRNADGTLSSYGIGPARVMLSLNLELRPGDPVSLRTATCNGQPLALAVTNAAGVTANLRQNNGSPVWQSRNP